MLRLIAAVPGDATPDDPAIHALVAHDDALRRSGVVPWWARSGTPWLRLGGMCTDGTSAIDAGLQQMRRLADCEDWGDDPTRTAPSDCTCSECRAPRAES
jgi:hypothetical protein